MEREEAGTGDGIARLRELPLEVSVLRKLLSKWSTDIVLPSPAQGGSFWSITSFGTFRPWGKFALNFCIELQGSNLLTVLAPNGFYIRADRSGTLLADSGDITKECIWEF